MPAGAPLGNQNAVKNKPWREAVDRALKAGDGQKLRAIADKLIDLAAAGDIQAIKELGDRLDGKAAQQVQLSGDSENPLQIVHESR